MRRFTPGDLPPEAHALKIAREVMGCYRLRGRKGVHDITAVEFYVSSPDHCDDANHCHPEQLCYGRWYVHTAKNLVSFKAPRYSGLDLTLGNAAAGIHAGMLIRQLDHDGGSGKAIMKLVRGSGVGEGILPAGHPLLRWNARELAFLNELQGRDAFKAAIRLEPRRQPLDGEVVAKKRVGIAGTGQASALLHFAFRPHRPL